METRPNDILNMIDVTREELFSVPSNSIILVDQNHTPCGEVYFRNDRVGVRFGDYRPSSYSKVLK